MTIKRFPLPDFANDARPEDDKPGGGAVLPPSHRTPQETQPMDHTISINVTLRPATPGDAGDTAGYIAREGGCFPQPSGSVLRVPIPVIIRQPLPGPPPVEILLTDTSADVQGYQRAEVTTGTEATSDDTAGYSVRDAPERERKAGSRADAVLCRLVVLPYSFGARAVAAAPADVGGFMMNSKYANGDVGKGTPGGGGGPGNTWGDLAGFVNFQKGFAELVIYMQSMEWFGL